MKTELQKKFLEQTPTVKDVTDIEDYQVYCSWLEIQIEKIRKEEQDKADKRVAEKTAKSGRKYKKVPENMDIETWDKMTVIERMKYLGVIKEKEM